VKNLYYLTSRYTINTQLSKQYYSWAPVAHTCNPPVIPATCNPSYSRSRDLEELSSKPDGTNSSRYTILKKPIIIIIIIGVGSKFKPQYLKKKKRILLL
jgi:hypothetical protein